MEKIKVSFELNDIWLNEAFRTLIQNIQKGLYNDCNTELELWIITTNDNSGYVNTIAGQLSIPIERVILCVNDSTKVGQITLNSDIHLDGSQPILTAVMFSPVYTVLVDNRLDYQNIGFKYITDLKKWIEIIIRDRNEKNKVY